MQNIRQETETTHEIGSFFFHRFKVFFITLLMILLSWWEGSRASSVYAFQNSIRSVRVNLRFIFNCTRLFIRRDIGKVGYHLVRSLSSQKNTNAPFNNRQRIFPRRISPWCNPRECHLLTICPKAFKNRCLSSGESARSSVIQQFMLGASLMVRVISPLCCTKPALHSSMRHTEWGE